MDKSVRILIACEESGTVTGAFRSLGFYNTFSCDILPTSCNHPEWHIQGDVIPLLNETWDAIIAFPPCTYLCSSGMHWTTRGLRDPKLTEDAKAFVLRLWNADCPHIAIENPIGVLSKAIRKPDQIVQPWMFGSDASKQTCLWLKGLPALEHTHVIPPKDFRPVVYAADLPLCDCCGEPWCPKHEEHYADCECFGPTQDGLRYVKVNGYEFACEDSFCGKPVWANQTPSGQNKLGPSDDRALLRAKTYPGLAAAMSTQWSNIKHV